MCNNSRWRSNVRWPRWVSKIWGKSKTKSPVGTHAPHRNRLRVVEVPAGDSFFWFPDAAKNRGVGPKRVRPGESRSAGVFQLPSHRVRPIGPAKMKAASILIAKWRRGDCSHFHKKARRQEGEEDTTGCNHARQKSSHDAAPTPRATPLWSGRLAIVCAHLRQPSVKPRHRFPNAMPGIKEHHLVWKAWR